jgi:hypothetical protein
MRGLVVVAVLLVVAALYFSLPSEEIHSPHPARAEAPPVSQPTQTPTPSASPTPLQRAIPSLDTLRKEREKDPHHVPPSLQKMAEAMTPRMEAALKSEREAEVLLGELDRCVRDHQADSVRAYCLSNARRLSAAHPSLAPKVESMNQAVPDRVRQTLDSLGF